MMAVFLNIIFPQSAPRRRILNEKGTGHGRMVHLIEEYAAVGKSASFQ